MKFNKKKLAILISGCFITANTLLANETTDLDSLIISAKAPVDQNNYSGSVSVITADDIKSSGATDLADVINLSPSVQLVSTYVNPSPAAQIRGFGTDQVLILVNGKRIPNIDRSVPREPAYRYGLVPLANIEKIEIIRGPASSLYGADALAGVINIITKKSTAEWSGSISLYGEVMDNANGGDSQGVSLSASGAVTDNIDLLISGQTSDRDEIRDDDNLASLQSSKDLDNYQAVIGIDLNNGDRIELSTLQSDDNSKEYDASGDEDDTTDVETKIFTAEYLTEIADFDSTVSYSTGESNVLEATRDWTVKEDSFAFDTQGYLNEKNYLSVGLTYREEEAIRDDTTTFQDKVDSTTLAAQNVFKMTDKASITLGLAFDDHSKYGSEVSPKVSVFNQLTPVLGVKASYGKSYLAPSISQGSSNYVVNAGPSRYLGNDDLKPETANTLELGVTFQQSHSQGAITLFRSDVEDLINTEVVSSTGVTIRQYENIESAILQGVEFTWSIFNDLDTQKLSLSYTYLDTENESNGKALMDRSDHLVKVNYLHKDLYSGFDLDAQARYVGDQFTNEANTEMLEGYFVADLGVSKQILDNTRVRFGINNLTDKVVMIQPERESERYLESGRSFKLSLTSTF
ncbi:TonB-dependent receptor plug domain-containing protein [Marinomonas posidonica]|uniref:TonB-dependent receptor plug domain-containing protein n=1 Tax=Marinomonas posidonica TaxID=936476 RepID=UPI0037364395